MRDPKIIPTEEVAQAVAGIASTLCLDDEIWGWFNMTRKRRGSFFERFVEPSVLAKENFLKQEIAIASLSRTLTTLHDAIEDPIKVGVIAARSLEILVDGKERQGNVWRAFGFPSREFALRHFCGSIPLYLSGKEAYSSLFTSRMVSVVTEEAKRSWLVGSVLLFAKPPFLTIRLILDEFLSGGIIDGKITVNDKAFRDFGLEIVKLLQVAKPIKPASSAHSNSSGGEDVKQV